MMRVTRRHFEIDSSRLVAGQGGVVDSKRNAESARDHSRSVGQQGVFDALILEARVQQFRLVGAKKENVIAHRQKLGFGGVQLSEMGIAIRTPAAAEKNQDDRFGEMLCVEAKRLS